MNHYMYEPRSHPSLYCRRRQQPTDHGQEKEPRDEDKKLYLKSYLRQTRSSLSVDESKYLQMGDHDLHQYLVHFLISLPFYKIRDLFFFSQMDFSYSCFVFKFKLLSPPFPLLSSYLEVLRVLLILPPFTYLEGQLVLFLPPSSYLRALYPLNVFLIIKYLPQDASIYVIYFVYLL